jgi:hypothetical protein
MDLGRPMSLVSSCYCISDTQRDRARPTFMIFCMSCVLQLNFSICSVVIYYQKSFAVKMSDIYDQQRIGTHF